MTSDTIFKPIKEAQRLRRQARWNDVIKRPIESGFRLVAVRFVDRRGRLDHVAGRDAHLQHSPVTPDRAGLGYGAKRRVLGRADTFRKVFEITRI